MRHPISVLGCLLVLAVASAWAEDWPGFRGPGGMGFSPAPNLPVAWGPEKNLLWKAALPPTEAGGRADHNPSSPIVVGDRLIVTTAHWPMGVEPASEFPDHRVSAYATKDGALLWSVPVPPGSWKLQDLRGGYAAPTPASDGKSVFAIFGSSILHALDLKNGRLIWSQVLPDHEQFDVAIASSPVIYQGSVIVLADRNGGKSTLTAYECGSGEIRWQQKRPETAFSHATPVLIRAGERDQLLVSSTHALQGISPADGSPLWSCGWGRSIWPVSAPVQSEGLVFCMGGRGGHPGLTVDPTGKGDVTETHLKWRASPTAEGMSSPAVVNGRIYRTHQPGVLSCMDLKSGNEVFKTRVGVDPRVSPVVTSDGRIFFASAGKSLVIEPAAEFQVLGESDLGDFCAASPAVAGGRMYLKGAKFLYAIGEK